MKWLWEKMRRLFGSRLPVIYAMGLVLLVPLTLVLNTVWNLWSFQRDMHLGVREQALAVEETIGALLDENDWNEIAMEELITNIMRESSSITGITVLVPADRAGFVVLATSDDVVGQRDLKLVTNELAWSQDEAFFQQVYDPTRQEQVWSVTSRFENESDEPIGLINVKVSIQRVEQVISRTVRDSLIILGVSVIFVVLLLLNHLKYFQQSLLVDKLKAIDQMKDDFISVASHELKTPLTAIKSYMFLVEQDLGEQLGEKNKERVGNMQKSIKRLENLVADLLNVSKIEQNKLDFSLSTVDINKIIGDVVTELRPTAEGRGLELRFVENQEVGSVLAQAERLQEVMINLVGNAVKYTKKGFVAVEVRQEKDMVHVLIKDTGIGISPEDKEKLFGKFNRIQSADTQDVPGTGLGLWITKSMVEKMNGKVYVDSILGQGTVFTVVLKVGH